MRTAAFVAALIAGVVAAPQAVTSAVAPKEETPAGCSTNYNGVFQVTVQPVSSKKRSLEKRQSVPLEITLKDGVLTDAQKRTGYIASNNQFQFDGPAQAGAIYTAGWSICNNGSIALGGSAIFYQCLSGSFYNLYDRSWAAQCSPIYLVALGGTPVTAEAASATADGQVQAATTASVLCQIGDGQIQKNTCVTTATPIQQQSDGQITAAKATITQISDGQIQAPVTSGSAAKTTPVTPTAAVATTAATAASSPAAASNGTIAASTRTPTAASTAAASATTSKPAASTGGASAFGASGLVALAAGAIAVLAL